MTASPRYFFRFIAIPVMLIAFSCAAQAAGTPEQRRACRGDAMRLCREFVPNVSSITACMQRNRRHLSPACRVYFR